MNIIRATATAFTSQRTFGIELEAIGLTQRQAAQAICDAGVLCHVESYGHSAPSDWKVVPDGSLPHDGFEVVSPILRGTEGIEQARKVAVALQAAGALVNGSCGFHVHVGAQDLSGADLMNIVRRYQGHSVEIDSVMHSSRRAGGSGARWCNEMSCLIADFRNLNNDATCQQVASRINSRYYKVNLHAFLRHGTVEFRQHNGTLNPEKIVNWIMFCVNFVEQSRMVHTTTQQPVSARQQPTGPSAGALGPLIQQRLQEQNGSPAPVARIRANALSVTYDRLEALLRVSSYGSPVSAATIAETLEIAEASVPSYISNFRSARRHVLVMVRRNRGYYANFASPSASATSATVPSVAPAIAPARPVVAPVAPQTRSVATLVAPPDHGPFATLPLQVQSFFCEVAQDYTA